MAPSAADISRERADARTASAAAPERARAPLFAAVALAVVLAAAGWGLVLGLVMVLDRPTPLPAPFPPQNQDAETLVLLLAYVVVLPAALLAGNRLADAAAGRVGVGALSVLVAGLVVTLVGGLVLVRAAGVVGAPDGVRTVLVVAVAWSLAAAAVLVRACRAPPWRALERLAVHGTGAWALAAVAIPVAVACFAPVRSISPVGLAVGALVALVAVAADRRMRLPRAWRIVLELLAVVLLLLAVPDLRIFRPEDAPGSVAISLETSIIRFHQNFLLGPASEVLHGGAMLVDTASQYGVGSIYLVAGWFRLLPIGYGTFGLLDAVLTTLWFGAGYVVVRAAGASRAVALPALGLAVVTMVFALAYPVGALPQYGPLRFGMPMAVLLAVVVAHRWPGASRVARVGALVVIGVSAIFSLEALVYTAVVYAAVLVTEACLRPRPGRVRWLVVQGAWAVLAGVVAHVLFASLTLAATGRLPAWGQYLDYLHVFLAGKIGNLTYDVPRWSAGVPIGAAYLASAATVVELVRRRHPLVAREPTALIALAGLTVYGVALLSYWDNRSLTHILQHVAFPVLLLAVVWLGVLRRDRTLPREARIGGFAVAVAIGLLALAVAWPSVGDRFGRSALAHVVPGGPSLGGALRRLRHPPPMDAAAASGQQVLTRYLPGEQRSLVMTAPDVGLEILVRSGRVNRLFLGDPQETSFVAGERLPDLRRQLASLRPGERMLLDASGLAALRALAAFPTADPLKLPLAGIAPLQVWALRQISRRFRLRTVARAQGFTVVALTSRRP